MLYVSMFKRFTINKTILEFLKIDGHQVEN